MATHKKEVSLTDLQQTILKNDLYSDYRYFQELDIFDSKMQLMEI